MAVARTLGVMAVAGLAGLGLFTADYLQQWSRAEGRFGGPQYMHTLIERFGDSGGLVGQVLRKSSLVAAARPPAPAGWTAEVWCDLHDAFLYSPAQAAQHQRELTRATLGLPAPDDLSRAELSAFDTYLDDTSIAYRNDQGIIGLSIHDPERRIAHPVFQAYLTAIDTHFDRIDTAIEYRTLQGLTWYEVHGPVELADNEGFPNRLRSFEARLGAVELFLTTRAPDHHISRFLETMDLTALRTLAADRPAPIPGSAVPSPELASAIPEDRAPRSGAEIRVNRGLD